MKRVTMLFAMLLILAVPMVAQEIDPPKDFIDLLQGVKTFFGSFAGAVVVTGFLTAFILRYLRDLVTAWKVILTGAVSILVALLAHWLPFGFLNDATIVYTLITAVGIFAVEFLGFSIPAVRYILEEIIENQSE